MNTTDNTNANTNTNTGSNKKKAKKQPDSDIEKYIEKQIEMKLNSLLETLPDKLPKELTIKPIYNLTIKEIYKNTLQSLIDIITDSVDVYSRKDYVNNNNYIYILLNILMKDDRKIYVGIMLVVLSFIVYFIDGVSV
jgi:predicted nuclease of restriction endonuclease-like RecB superfamily